MDNNLMEIKDIKQKYEELKKRYEDLIIEFSENTIISSMNDMKNEYNILEKNYRKVREKNKTFTEILKAIKIMLDTVIKSTAVKSIDSENDHLMMYMFQYELKLKFINEIVEQHLEQYRFDVN